MGNPNKSEWILLSMSKFDFWNLVKPNLIPATRNAESKSRIEILQAQPTDSKSQIEIFKYQSPESEMNPTQQLLPVFEHEEISENYKSKNTIFWKVNQLKYLKVP